MGFEDHLSRKLYSFDLQLKDSFIGRTFASKSIQIYFSKRREFYLEILNKRGCNNLICIYGTLPVAFE
jgi:hypothetical protein